MICDTFGSLLIRDGASPAYAKDQMGHSSLQVTVDTYGHLISERTSRGSIGWMSKQRRNKMQLPRNLQLEAKRKFRRK
jgi:integrase